MAETIAGGDMFIDDGDGDSNNKINELILKSEIQCVFSTYESDAYAGLAGHSGRRSVVP